MEKTLEKILTKLTDLEKRVSTLETNTKKIRIKKKTPNSGKKKSSKKEIKKEGIITITKYNNGSVLTGDTYDKKGIIKKYKGWWTPTMKGWTVKLEYYQHIKEELLNCTLRLTEKLIDKKLDYIDVPYNAETQGKKENNSKTLAKNVELDFLSDSD